MRILLTCVAAASLLGGCLSSLLPDPGDAPLVYRLIDPAAGQGKVPGAAVVRVDNVSSPSTYKTNDILLLTADGTLSAASGARWSDDIPEILQDAMLTRLANSDEFIGIIPVAGARSSLRLHLDTREFAASYLEGDLAPPTAVVHVYATVSEAASRNFVGSFDSVARVRAVDNRVSAIVDAQSVATEQALDAVVEWMENLPITDALPDVMAAAEPTTLTAGLSPERP